MQTLGANLDNKVIHVVSFQIPYPANYGGVIEVFYKLKALKQASIKVILHCYEYKNRNQEDILLKYADKVYYYKRKTGILSHFSPLPYIVASRHSTILRKNLLKDNYPILLEGLHTCFILGDKAFCNRKIMVRTHNIEHQYYRGLYRATQNPINKFYYLIEAFKLKHFEYRLKYSNNIFAISTQDTTYFQSKFSNVQTKYLPCFFDNSIQLENNSINHNIATISDYILFNADLSIDSNIKVATFLLKEIIPLIDNTITFIIAGRNPQSRLISEVNKHANVHIKANVSQKEMESLIKYARINLLFTFQASGIKLKLLTTLLHARGHCISNDTMLVGTNLQGICPVVNNTKEIVSTINNLFHTMPSEGDIVHRRFLISQAGYNNSVELIKQEL